jgi:REP element-mobilizing transposase RayT
MARKLRIEYPGAIYHVTMRGNARMKLFLDDRDYERFLWRLSESADTYNIRIYLFCLMTNHVHLVLETPEGNLSRFMQSLQTGYTVYFNLRHHRSGHVMQGRFGAKVVEGDSYLLSLARYVHLNPVYVRQIKNMQLRERIQYLRSYRWSSYSSYTGRSKELKLVEYGPVLAQLRCRSRKDARKRFREYVESGISETDKEFMEALKESRHAIGSGEFRNRMNELYMDLVEKKDITEDVSFRRIIEPIASERIIEVICGITGEEKSDILRRRRGSSIRARMLSKYGGLTQREVAKELNIISGAAVSDQLRRLKERRGVEKNLNGLIVSIEKALDKERGER